MKKEIIEWIVAIIVAIVIVTLVQKFLFASYTVKGASMHPTFENREKVIVSRIAKTLDHIDTGDVVIFHANAKQDYIKRLIGKPGDSVENKKHKVGEYLTENFKSRDLKGTNGNMKIPSGKYLVLGDNRQNSIDSRMDEVGLLDKNQVVGKVVLRYWPFNRWGGSFNPGTFPN